MQHLMFDLSGKVALVTGIGGPVDATGNGRRESYAHDPMPRMTNTYMENGNDDPQEILASMKKGIYAVNFFKICFSILKRAFH